jgi:hypothetical protein
MDWEGKDRIKPHLLEPPLHSVALQVRNTGFLFEIS